MASVLDSTTANKVVTSSDDTAVCGYHNVRTAVGSITSRCSGNEPTPQISNVAVSNCSNFPMSQWI